jgi:hypothetical protein
MTTQTRTTAKEQANLSVAISAIDAAMNAVDAANRELRFAGIGSWQTHKETKRLANMGEQLQKMAIRLNILKRKTITIDPVTLLPVK